MRYKIILLILFSKFILLSQNKIIVKVDSSITNELIQDFTKNGNTITLTDAGGFRNVNIAVNAPALNNVLTWNGSQWVAAVPTGEGGGGGGVAQTLETNNTPGNISIRFQFYNSPIKRWLILSFLHNLDLFQFYNSPIKSYHGWFATDSFF